MIGDRPPADAVDAAASIDGAVTIPSITCPVCGAVSYHPADIEQRYCGRCHQFHDYMHIPTTTEPEETT